MQANSTPFAEPEPLDDDTPQGSGEDFDEFIYLISHDVRSSVRALLELPQWIAEDLEQEGFELKGQVAASFELLNRHTGRLDQMLEDLLTFSRIGRMQTVSTLDLDQVLSGVLEEIVVPEGFTLKRCLSARYAKVGDRDIGVLLKALVSNVVKHHDSAFGEITVTIDEQDGGLIISVEDDGPGIPQEQAERVFAAMTTLRPRDDVEGSGMGLAIVRKIARSYGGDAVVAHSPSGKGAKVSVSLKCDVTSVELKENS